MVKLEFQNILACVGGFERAMGEMAQGSSLQTGEELSHRFIRLNF